MTIINGSDKPDKPDVILLADPVVHVERLERGLVAVVQIRLSWPGGEQPDMVIPFTEKSARLLGEALIDSASHKEPVEDA